MSEDSVDKEKLKKLYLTQYITVMVLCFTTIVSSVYTTAVLFLYRQKNQRPIFVVWQTVFLNLYWMTYLAFFIQQGVSSINNYENVD